MEPTTSRFIFRGNAAAIGGRISRPVDLMLESSAASSLTVAGGRSRSRVAAQTYGEYVRIGSASTLAEGVFDDAAQLVERTFGRVREDALTTSTTVSAEILELAVGTTPRVSVKRLHAELHGRSPGASGQPRIALAGTTVIDGLTVDGHGLIVDIDMPAFQQYDTHARLVAAADDAQFVKDHGPCFLTRPMEGGRQIRARDRFVESCCVLYATIVRSVRWAGAPYPGARIDHHVVTVPEFGRIFLGEMIITDISRRLTLMRMDLGSPVGGTVAAGEVETNGSWSS